MAIVTKSEVVQIEKTRNVRVSDFSGVEIPGFHWSTVTNFHCYTSDHGHLKGNKKDVFILDLMPEEMADFFNDLQRLVSAHKEKRRNNRA